MYEVTDSENDAFFGEVGKAAATAVWCVLATTNDRGWRAS